MPWLPILLLLSVKDKSGRRAIAYNSITLAGINRVEESSLALLIFIYSMFSYYKFMGYLWVLFDVSH
jgi:hypothetical protein